MVSPSVRTPAPLVVVCGDDEFAVKRRAREIHEAWRGEIGGMDHEIIDAAAGNSGEALGALARLREALRTLPFFGGAKTVWLQNCSFLGDDRTSGSAAVTAALGDLAAELKVFTWSNVRLLISAGKVDRRKTFYKTVDKIGTVEVFTAWSTEDRDWAGQAEAWARDGLRAVGKEIGDEAVAVLVAGVGPHVRLLAGEIEKLSLFVGDRRTIELTDVSAICSRSKNAQAFALGDALGDRDLPRLLQCLDEELWELKLSSQKSEIGLLYGLISKVRTMVLLKEMLTEGWLKPVPDYGRFKAQLQRVPPDRLPGDRRFNPLAINPYVLFKALGQVGNYSRDELVRAMELLLDCNRRLVSSSLDSALVLQQTLIDIVQRPGEAKTTRNAA